jgi:hypothetical protein
VSCISQVSEFQGFKVPTSRALEVVVSSVIPSDVEGPCVSFKNQSAAKSFQPGFFLFDQPHFLFATPAFELLLPVNRVSYVVETFPAYKARAIVIVAEALESMVLMMPEMLS